MLSTPFHAIQSRRLSDMHSPNMDSHRAAVKSPLQHGSNNISMEVEGKVPRAVPSKKKMQKLKQAKAG